MLHRPLGLGLAAVALLATTARAQVQVASPDGRNQIPVEVREGRLTYSLTRDGRWLILPSLLGFAFRGAPPLRDGLRIVDTTRDAHDETWTQPWGEVARVRDHHNELAVSVERAAAPHLKAICRDVAPKLNKIGLSLINVNIAAMTDEPGYLDSIGKKAASEAINQAKVDVAEQDKKGAIGEAEAIH